MSWQLKSCCCCTLHASRCTRAARLPRCCRLLPAGCLAARLAPLLRCLRLTPACALPRAALACSANKCPVPPAGRGKLSVYVTSCRLPREAAVAHDVSVVWYQLALAGQGAAAGPAAAPAAAATGWETDAAVLKQLNFGTELYTSSEALVRQLQGARSLPDLRAVMTRLRSAGTLAQLAAASRAMRTSPALGSPPAHLGASRRKASAGWGCAPRRTLAGSPVEPGKHGRLHQATYFGLVRDRQTTGNAWRPMICTAVAGALALPLGPRVCCFVPRTTA